MIMRVNLTRREDIFELIFFLYATYVWQKINMISKYKIDNQHQAHKEGREDEEVAPWRKTEDEGSNCSC